MNIITKPNFDSLSEHAALDLFALLQTIPQPLICVASGASPAGLYKQLIELVKTSGTDISNWYFIGLDEWKGMNGNDEGSSRYQLNEQLFTPLNIREENIYFFNGRAEDAEAECTNAEAFIAQHNGIDVAILGIGVNAHIAMNEPGTSAALRSHVASILPETQAIGQKYFKEQKQIDSGITLGLASLLEAKHIYVLASGSSKAQAIYRMMHAPVSVDCPASYLRAHENISVYLDEAAAGKIVE
jgi:glucosamine-6-phosphate isomerase